MKILMLLPELRLRGGIRRSLLLSQGLATRGHAVAISCPGGPMLPWLTGSDAHEDALVPEPRRSGDHGARPGLPRMISTRQPKPLFSFTELPWKAPKPGMNASWLEAQRLVRKVQAFDPDVVHVGSLTWPSPWWPVIRKTSAVRVATVHGVSDVRTVSRRQLSSFDTLIAVSRKVQESLINEAAQPIARIRHVAAGAPVVRSRSGGGGTSGGIPANPVVACVDPLITPDAVLTLLEAVKLLRSGGVDALALVVGEGPASPLLRQWTREHGAMEWAVLAEATYDPDGVLCAADAVVACGGTLDSAQFAVEGMGRGIPAVFAGAEGNYELVVDGESGVIYEPGSATSLAGQLREVLTDATLRARLARGGMAAVADRLSLGAMIDATLVAYDRGRGVAASQRLSTVSVPSGRSPNRSQSTALMRSGSRRTPS